MVIKCGNNSANNLLKARPGSSICEWQLGGVPRVLADAVFHPLFHDNHDGSIHLVPTKFKHIYQNLRHLLNEKPIESNSSIHSVAQTLIKEKEKNKRMDKGMTERQSYRKS